MTEHKLDFDQAMSRLSEIVKALDDPNLSLEASIELFEEGLRLSAQCQNQLKHFEDKIDTIAQEHLQDEGGSHEDTTG